MDQTHGKSSIDLAMGAAFRKMRRFLMDTRGDRRTILALHRWS
jgi:hypothetical protein